MSSHQFPLDERDRRGKGGEGAIYVPDKTKRWQKCEETFGQKRKKQFPLARKTLYWGNGPSFEKNRALSKGGGPTNKPW